jgi:hypothetical protein
MSAEIRSAVEALLSAAHIQFVPTLTQRGALRASEVKGQRPWEHDVWACQFRRNGADFTITYRTGIGHRAMPRGFVQADPRIRPGTIAWEEQERRKVPMPPNVADVLHSIVSDDTRGESFEGWCADFGLDVDSRSALAMYLECQEQTEKALRFFGRALWASIQNAVEGY